MATTPGPRREAPAGLQAHVHMIIRRNYQRKGWVTCRVYKGWWGGPGVGGLQRTVTEMSIDCTGLTEEQAMLRAYEVLGRALPLALG